MDMWRTDDLSARTEGSYTLLANARTARTAASGTALVLVALLLVSYPNTASGSSRAGSPQNGVEVAREAMAAGDASRAAQLLRAEVQNSPTADAYLYLGIALANLSQTTEALEVLTDGSTLYPTDSRFHDEIAGVHLAGRNIDLAAASLERAIEINPQDAYASDLLASIRLSEGQVRDALAIWNAVDQPEIDRVLQNFAPGLVDDTVPRALAFGSGDTLRFPAWKTTEMRLFGSHLYSNVGIELEPSSPGDRFNAIVRTSARRNTASDILLGLVRGLPKETVYFDFWDIDGSGVSWRSSFRWDKDRRRLRGQLIVPLPFSGLPVLELEDTWRQERWNLEPSIRDSFRSDALFEYKVNALAASVTSTPHYRVSLHGGLEYRNRDVTGTIDELGMDGRNSGKFTLGTVIRPVDRRYSNQIRLDGFVARDSFLGDFNFHGGTLEVANRFIVREQTQTFFDFGITGGTARGEVPVDHYFILGLSSLTDHPLRAHPVSDGGRYGQAPMGTDFVLFNSDVEHRIATIPMFNTLSIPYINIKVMGFFDAGKTFDRNRVFRQDDWFRDVGAGMRFETPTSAFTILYGRDLTGSENSFYAYVEPVIW